MKLLLSVVACAGIFVFPAVGQDPPQQTLAFTLGSTIDDTYKTFGNPKKWYVLQSGRFLNSLEEFTAASKVYPAVADVYERGTPTNFYQLKVFWEADGTTSRLRPTPRISRMEAEIDKPAPTKAILADLIEAREICKTGCDLYGVTDVLESYVVAYPRKPSRDQLEMGALLANGFKPSDTHGDWCVGIKLKFDAQGGSKTGVPNWNSIPVVRIEIDAISREYELNKPLARSMHLSPTIKIGEWIP